MRIGLDSEHCSLYTAGKGDGESTSSDWPARMCIGRAIVVYGGAP